MIWTDTKGETQTEYFAKDKLRSAKDRFACIDEFLVGALHRIGDTYKYKNCSAILIDLIHNGALRISDLPDGLKLTYNEVVWCQLIHTKYSEQLWGTMESVSKKHGTDSPEFETAGISFYKETKHTIAQCLSAGDSSKSLTKFSPTPKIVVILDGNDLLAHHAISGKRIAFNGKNIEKESVKNCQCDYCK